MAAQIEEEIRKFSFKTGLRSCAIFGGVSMGRQISQLKRGTEIVVACPGRLLDHINTGTIKLSSIETLVLDEADQMFDMGFLPDVRKIIKSLPKNIQTLLFSATMPGDIKKLAGEVLKDPVTVKVGRTAPVSTVSHSMYPVIQSQKSEILLTLLKKFDAESTLIFTRTKHRAKSLAIKLSKHGYKVASLQGNLSQSKRKSAMDGFRSGKYQILVATDIAARGIDISSISHVVNFDIPETTDAYTHRIGRTGRATRSGDAITFVTPQENSKVRAIERLLGKPIERKKLEGFTYKNSDTHESNQRPRQRRRYKKNWSRSSRAEQKRFSRNNNQGRRRNRSVSA